MKLSFVCGLFLAGALQAQELEVKPAWLGQDGPKDAWANAALSSEVARVQDGAPESWTPEDAQESAGDETAAETANVAQTQATQPVDSESADDENENAGPPDNNESGDGSDDDVVADDPGEDAEELAPPKKVDPIAFVPGQTCVSLGKANNGALINGVPLNNTDYLISMKSTRYGTPELVSAIKEATEAVNRKYPGSHKVIVRDLSAKEGGPLRPHLSHQAGCDVDIGYYFKDREPQSFVEATPRNLDVARTWTLIESFLADGKTEYIFMDYGIQKPLYEYLHGELGFSDTKLRKIISYPHGKRLGIIRDAKGHKNHMHVRIWCLEAKAAVKDYVKRYGNSALKPLPVYYTVKKGDTLTKIAKKKKCKVDELKKWNNFKKRKRKTLKLGEKLIVGYSRPKLPGM